MPEQLESVIRGVRKIGQRDSDWLAVPKNFKAVLTRYAPRRCQSTIYRPSVDLPRQLISGNSRRLNSIILRNIQRNYLGAGKVVQSCIRTLKVGLAAANGETSTRQGSQLVLRIIPFHGFS